MGVVLIMDYLTSAVTALQAREQHFTNQIEMNLWE